MDRRYKYIWRYSTVLYWTFKWILNLSFSNVYSKYKTFDVQQIKVILSHAFDMFD